MSEVLLFSPIRTGSTLIYNILKHLKFIVLKRHLLKVMPKIKNVIITYRNPLDSLSSLFLKENMNINSLTVNDLNWGIDTLKEQGLDKLIKIFNNEKFLYLKYELFVHNYSYIYKKLEKYLNITISSKDKTDIYKKFNINSVKKSIKRFNNFLEWDKNTLLHGNHISKYNGDSHYKKTFTKEQINYITNKLTTHLTILNYKIENT